MGYDFTSFDNGEDIVVAVKKSDIKKFVDGKQNINIKIYRELMPKNIEKNIQNPLFKRKKTNLTSRELQVLRYLVQGKNNLKIAKELCVSRHTVKAHVANILQKLEVNDRFQAALKAITENIV